MFAYIDYVGGCCSAEHLVGLPLREVSAASGGSRSSLEQNRFAWNRHAHQRKRFDALICAVIVAGTPVCTSKNVWASLDSTALTSRVG
jgi:hypothetical protein